MLGLLMVRVSQSVLSTCLNVGSPADYPFENTCNGQLCHNRCPRFVAFGGSCETDDCDISTGADYKCVADQAGLQY